MDPTGGTPAPGDDVLGRVLGGRYRVDRHLRRGGMGSVYVARDTAEERDVAVKVIRQSLLEDPQALARFKREARLVSELAHDNIVRSFGAGDDAGFLWIAMELLEGESLRDRLDARGRMTWQETLPLVEQIVQALGAAHDQGIIHRDLKPENIMLVTRAAAGEQVVRAKLLDFGVAKQARVEGDSSATSNMTGTGLIVGTPGYVAPEVVLDGTTDDPRSDFYGLGVVWFEMLTGQKPFTAKTAFALAMRHAHERAPTPTSFVPYSPVPAPIERLVLQLLEKAPQARPQDARALLLTLTSLAEESQRSLAGTPPPSLEPHDPTMTDLANVQRTGVMPLAGTPATGMVRERSAAPVAPAGVTPVPELLRQIPKKTIALAAAALFAVIVVVVVVVVAVVTVGLREDEALAEAPPVPPVSPAPAAVAVAAPAPPPSALPAPPAPAPPAPPADVDAAPPRALIAARREERRDDRRDVVKRLVERREEKREERREERQEAREEPREVRRDASGVGVLKFVPRPKPMGWLVSIDGALPSENRTFTLAAGRHELVITTPKDPALRFVRTVVVPSNDDFVFDENLLP